MAIKRRDVLAAWLIHPGHAALLAAGVLTLAALLAYANTWSVPFLFDDLVTIVDNSALRDSASLPSVLNPASYTGVGGRPIANLSFVLNYAMSELAVWGYHAVNLAVHLLASLALYGAVRRSLLLPALAPRFGRESWAIALAVAGLWLLHPVHTQAVTYVSQRTESLMGMFYLVTLYGFVRGAEAPGRPGWLALSVASCFAGMATKEVMVTAPVMVLLYDWAFVAGTVGEAWRRRRAYYVGLGSSWVLLCFLMSGLAGRGVGFGLGFERLVQFCTGMHNIRDVIPYPRAPRLC